MYILISGPVPGSIDKILQVYYLSKFYNSANIFTLLDWQRQ